MIIDNIEFHNIDGVLKKPYGDLLMRYPEELVPKLNRAARYMSRYACNSEIRFITKTPQSFVTLMSEEGDARVVVYYGDCVQAEHMIKKGVITRIPLFVPENLKTVDEAFFEKNLFAKNMWRIHLHGMISFCGLDTLDFPHRPPEAAELPQKTMLSYGSSISHGSGALYNPLTYVNTLARLLRADCLAKGVGGACFAEPEIADSFSERDDWDFALLELGVNMIDSFEVPEFEKRFNYFADTMYKTGKKLIFTTIFKNSDFYRNNEFNRQMTAFSEIIRKKCAEFDKERVLLVEGTDILDDTAMLTTDGIHPSTEGHVKMGFNLYERVKDFVK